MAIAKETKAAIEALARAVFGESHKFDEFAAEHLGADEPEEPKGGK